MGRRPKRRERPLTRTCMTPGCGRTMAAWKWLCDGCYASLPFQRRKSIAEARQRQEPSRVFGLCRDAAEWLVERRRKLAGEG
jgi:hypothetical protein